MTFQKIPFLDGYKEATGTIPMTEKNTKVSQSPSKKKDIHGCFQVEVVQNIRKHLEKEIRSDADLNFLPNLSPQARKSLLPKMGIG